MMPSIFYPDLRAWIVKESVGVISATAVIGHIFLCGQNHFVDQFAGHNGFNFGELFAIDHRAG